MSLGIPGRPIGERRIAFGPMKTTTIQIPEIIWDEYRKRNINVSDFCTKQMLFGLGASNMPELFLKLKEVVEKEKERRDFDDWFGLGKIGLDSEILFKTHESRVYMTFSDHLKRIFREVMLHDEALEHAPNELSNRSREEIMAKVYEGVNALRSKVRMSTEQADTLTERIVERCMILMENDIYWKKESKEEKSTQTEEEKQGDKSALV